MLIVLIGVFIISLYVLVISSEKFVEYAARMARLVGCSEFTIGLTLVAVGTSIPELAVSVMASISGNTGVIMGNIMGSNIADIGLVLGITSVISALEVNRRLLRGTMHVLLVSSLIFFVFGVNHRLTLIEGIVLLLIFLVYTWREVKSKREIKGSYEKFVNFEKKNGFLNKHHIVSAKKYDVIVAQGLSYRLLNALKMNGIKTYEVYREKLKRDVMDKLVLCCVMLVGVLGSSKYLVDAAVDIAQALNFKPEFIGLTAIAIGTSLPELSVSISAARKGLSNIVYGNVIGSCIANILLIGGISSVLRPLVVSSVDVVFVIPFMILMTVILYRSLHTEWYTKTLEGIFLLGLYAVYLVIVSVLYVV